MRSPFQILAIPYRKDNEYQFCVFHRADIDQYQFVAGGGEDDENALSAAIREIKEETGLTVTNIISLTSMTYIPANVISKKHRRHWDKDIFVIPEYTFGFECNEDIKLSNEHLEFKWLNYDETMNILTWDSNKTALYELSCRLHTDS